MITSKPLSPSPFALHHGESVRRGLARVLGQVALQARHLKTPAPELSAEALHLARLLLKRLRALLWFAGPALPLAERARAKVQLREASHLLAGQRDGLVWQSILEDLSRNPALAGLAEAPRGHSESERKGREAVKTLLATARYLQRKLAQASRWPDSAMRLAKATAAMSRAGRKALRKRSLEHWHEWRKKAKRLLYLLELTEMAPGRRMRRTIRRVEKLQAGLGEYHDYTLAQRRLQTDRPGELSPRLVRRSVRLLQTRRVRLRKKVRKLAKKLL